jgi:hypothetical protein
MRAAARCLIQPWLVLAAVAAWASPAAAQAPREPLSLQGYGMAGAMIFTASQSFEAVLDTDRGGIFGGGLRLVIPGGPYLDVGAWRFSKDGERAFISDAGAVFPLGIPLTVTMTPLEITGGWRFPGLLGRVTPYAGGGFTSLRYEETSEFAGDGENVSERFNGYHFTGGADVRLARWVAIGGDVTWTSVGDAIGEGGVSQAFEEDDLGGTSFRVRFILGR